MPIRRPRPSLHRAAFAALLLASVGSTASAQSVVADFTAGPPTGRYSFASSTPKTVVELMKGTGQGEAVNVTGHFFLPPGTEKVPAIVLMHGSGGLYEAMLDFWPKQFNAAGIAVLSVDSFGPRGVEGTVDDQTRVPFAADSADAFAALRLLATHPRIDAKRIAIMGFSRGGITTWRAAIERLVVSQNLPDGLRFAAHIPTYSGGCSGLLRLRVAPGVFSKSPMLWIHGDADDYTPIGACREYADLIAKAGTPVEFVTIPGAHHKFDSDDTRRVYVRSATKMRDDCPLEMDFSSFGYYDRFTGQRVQRDALAAVTKGCRQTGANVEGNRSARDQAAKAAVSFLRKVFGLS